MKKEYKTPSFEKFIPQLDEFCFGGASSPKDDSFGGNFGEGEDILDD